MQIFHAGGGMFTLGTLGKPTEKCGKTRGKTQLVGVSTTMLVGDNGENQTDFHEVIVG